jgi:DNA-binding PadR family transcriptional regulator
MARPYAKDSAAKEWMQGSSELKGPLLSLLIEQPGHAYNLAGRLYQRLGAYWQIDAKELYPMLKRFERLGLASSHEAPSSKSPMRKIVYEPTERARGAVSDWMASPLASEPKVRAEIWARIAFSEPADAPRLLKALNDYQRTCYRAVEEMKNRYPIDTWRGMEMELVRKAATLRIEAELEWIHVARGYIANFPGERRVFARV